MRTLARSLCLLGRAAWIEAATLTLYTCSCGFLNRSCRSWVWRAWGGSGRGVPALALTWSSGWPEFSPPWAFLVTVTMLTTLIMGRGFKRHHGAVAIRTATSYNNPYP